MSNRDGKAGNRSRSRIKHASKFICVGPGGTGCSCCFPARGYKERRAIIRRAKRAEKRFALKIEDTAHTD